MTQVALVGPPNAGKSSLFNVIAERFGHAPSWMDGKPSPAIVSPHRGTTRDYLTASIQIGGVRCELLDTAGVDEAPRSEHVLPKDGAGANHWRLPPHDVASQGQTASAIDAAAQSIAVERRQAAAIRVCCVDAMVAGGHSIAFAGCDIVAVTKSDLGVPACGTYAAPPNVSVVATSSRTGAGIEELCRQIGVRLVADANIVKGQTVAATAERCHESIRLAESAISRAIQIVSRYDGDELAAAELRVALAELGKVVGAVYTDDLLDRIFSTFCIGK